MEIKNIGQLLQHLATKAGIENSDQNLVNILSNAELSKVTVSSDLVKSIDENLLSVNMALDNHPKIKNHYNALALNVFDTRMEAFMKESGLSEEKLTELKAVKNTYQRFEALTAAIKEAEAAKAATKDTGDKTALQSQVDDLLKQLQAAKKDHETKLREVEDKAKSDRKNDRIGFELRSILSATKTIFDELAPEVKYTTIKTLVEKTLQDKKAEFGFDDNDAFVLKNSDGTTFIGANHQKHTPAIFIDEILAQNKILVVTETPKQQTKQGNDGSGTKPVTVQATQSAPAGNNQVTTANLNRQMRESAAETK